MKKQRGFTLVELLVVLLILAAILIIVVTMVTGKFDARRMMAFGMPREAAVLELQRINDRADSLAKVPVKVETVYADPSKKR